MLGPPKGISPICKKFKRMIRDFYGRKLPLILSHLVPENYLQLKPKLPINHSNPDPTRFYPKIALLSTVHKASKTKPPEHFRFYMYHPVSYHFRDVDFKIEMTFVVGGTRVQADPSNVQLIDEDQNFREHKKKQKTHGKTGDPKV
jgi:hypothetical protein